MTPDERIDASLIENPAAPPIAVPVKTGPALSNITVTKGDGRVFDLGKPGDPKTLTRWRFNRRLSKYKKECDL